MHIRVREHIFTEMLTMFQHFTKNPQTTHPSKLGLLGLLLNKDNNSSLVQIPGDIYMLPPLLNTTFV